MSFFGQLNDITPTVVSDAVAQVGFSACSGNGITLNSQNLNGVLCWLIDYMKRCPPQIEASAPSAAPVNGQSIWHVDTSTDAPTLYVWDGSTWINLAGQDTPSGAIAGAGAPTDAPTANEPNFYIDTSTDPDSLYFWDGANWLAIGSPVTLSGAGAPTAAPAAADPPFYVDETNDNLYYWDGGNWDLLTKPQTVPFAAAAPTTAPAAADGNLYIDTTTAPDTLYYWDGVAWNTIGGGTTTTRSASSSSNVTVALQGIASGTQANTTPAAVVDFVLPTDQTVLISFSTRVEFFQGGIAGRQIQASFRPFDEVDNTSLPESVGWRGYVDSGAIDAQSVTGTLMVPLLAGAHRIRMDLFIQTNNLDPASVVRQIGQFIRVAWLEEV